MASAGVRAYKGFGGRAPIVGPGSRAPGGSQGAKPPEADGILALSTQFFGVLEIVVVANMNEVTRQKRIHLIPLLF